MTAGEYCTREVIITTAETSVVDAAKLMREHHVGDLVIVQQQGEIARPVGMVTDRDLVVEVLAQEIPLESVTVGDVMSPELYAVEEQDNLEDAVALMRKHGVRRIAVLTAEGTLAGILSTDDALEIIADTATSLVSLVRNEIHQEQRFRP